MRAGGWRRNGIAAAHDQATLVPAPSREHAKPPTIGCLKAMGVDGVDIVCRDCRRSTSLPFDAIALPDQTLFPDVVKLRRFRCEGCGSTRAVVTPDWRGMKAPGAVGF